MEPSEKTPYRASPRNDTSANKKSLFTPCRRVGLKRRSSGLPGTPGIGTPNSTFKNHRLSFETPERATIVTKSTPSPGELLQLDSEVSLLKTDLNKTECATVCGQTDYITPKHLGLKHQDTPKKLPPLPEISDITDELSYSEKCEYPTEKMLLTLRKRVEEKEKQVEELKEKRMGRQEKVNDTGRLQERTEVWRTGCQNALRQLHDKTLSLGHQVTMTEMITQLSIPFDLILYDPELEDFKET